MSEKSRRALILAQDILVVFFVAYAVIGMITAKKDSVLVTRGLGAFKYYTVLSNILCAITSLVCVIYMLFNMTNGDKALPNGLYILHLTGCSVVSVTFIVVMIFLGPTFGYPLMFTGVSFWLHLVAPVLSIVAQILLKQQKPLRLRATLWAVVPTIIYGIVYVSVNAANWTGKSNRATDIYGFLTWGWGIGAVILISICVINWLIALLYWKLGKPDAVKKAVKKTVKKTAENREGE